ncbi:MAG: hypothetical protein RL757_2899, partial [Bacteroidota bacterium]
MRKNQRKCGKNARIAEKTAHFFYLTTFLRIFRRFSLENSDFSEKDGQ